MAQSIVNGQDVELFSQVAQPSTVVFDGEVLLDDAEAAETDHVIEVAQPTTYADRHAIIIGGTDTELVVRLTNLELIGDELEEIDIATFTIAADSTASQHLVSGFLLGDGGRIVITNSDEIGASAGFTTFVRVRTY